jgi:hypothetical protein
MALGPLIRQPRINGEQTLCSASNASLQEFQAHDLIETTGTLKKTGFRVKPGMTDKGKGFSKHYNAGSDDL